MEILRQELGRFEVELERVVVGRPTTVTIQAAGGPVAIGEVHDDWFVQLERGETATAQLLYCTRRSRGHAGFSASGFLDPKSPEVERSALPQLYFMVLLEERRVWAVARTALRDIYRKLRRGGQVPRFSLTKAEGALRIVLPKKVTGIDLDQCIMSGVGAVE